MKKVILSIALVAGLGAMTNVSAMNISNNNTGIVTSLQDNGFVDVKFEELNEKVQASVKLLIQEYDLNGLKYNAEKQITKVDATKKADQSKKVFFFDAEGKEVNMEAAPVEQKNEETTEQKEQEQAPSIDFMSVAPDSGFVDVKFNELNENVQAAIREIDKSYDLNSLQYNAEKQITKVKATKKDDQSKKVFFLDNEGKEVAMEEVATEQKMEETTQQEQAPGIESFDVMQDDGFVDVKIEDLNEKVQAAVRSINEAYDLNALQYNSEKQLTRVEATKKDDQSKKTFYLDNQGVEVTPEQPAQNTESQETEETE